MNRSLRTVPVLLASLACALVLACGGNGTTPAADLPSLDARTDARTDAPGDDIPGDDVPGTDPGPACQDECSQEGATDCAEGGVRTCADTDDDGCVEWTLPVACPDGKACKFGQCVVTCPDAECSVIGAHRCQPATTLTIQECGDFDSDGCLQWGNPVDCGGGLVCSNGFCATSCENGCTTIGARKCELNTVVTCGDYNTDGCLEWGDASDCAPLVCANGYCKSECQDECTTPDARKCDGGGYKVCGNADDDPCLEWGTVQNCGQDQSCSNGYCGDVCQDECTVNGAKKCDEAGAVVTCADTDGDPCLEWGSPTPCDEGLVCAGGFCETQCQDDCTVAKARKCDEGGQVVVCDEYDGDGCLEWGSASACDDPLVCDQGNCKLACSDECAVKNSKRCTPGSPNQFESCDEYDGDGCLEWGTPVACEGTLVCSGQGDCTISCSSDCAVVDDVKCEGDAVRTCDDYNGDTCLEWGTPAPCESFQQCQGGACVQKDPPAKVVIAEVLFDSAGFPDTDTFVELAGPAGTDLTGWVLAGVNGSDGKDYGSAYFVLAGVIPADGRFVLSHPDAQASIHDQADQLMNKSDDIQNGPDSLQLRYGTKVVDAVGYGTFPVPANFAGEGSPAARPVEGHSLARNASDGDTDDNAADFADHGTPTPGAANVAVNEEPVAALSCTGSVLLGQEATLDASASGDSDGGITTYAFDFGDGTPAVSGAASTTTHAYATTGLKTVTVTVTDNGGATDQATCQVAVGDDKVPTAVIIKPADDTQVTQGATVNVLADATPAGGRAIEFVELLVDGTPTGATDDSPPYEFAWVVPMAQPKDSTVVLVAKAVDDQGSTGLSAGVHLRVRNDPPVPSFTAVVSGALEVTMDANSSTDTETPGADLEVRWDYTNDGTWDTGWSTTKVAVHTYDTDGQYTIKMEVRDAIGQTVSLARDVTLSSLQYVSGTVTTTTWTGTIVITGDVVVPAANTLTVAEGTSVLFAYIDQNTDGAGDYDIVVNGTLDVNGTQAKPVLFTTYGGDHKAAMAWNTLRLAGTGSTVDWAIVEYADTGLDIRDDATVRDTVVRLGRTGLSVNASGKTATLARVTSTRNGGNGLGLANGTVAATYCTLSDNEGRGAYATGGTLDLSESIVTGNALAGLEWSGAGNGTVTHNLVTGNDLEGIRITTNGSTDPAPVVNYNNVYGNALVKGRVAGSPDLSVATTAGYYGTSTSSAWSTPSAEVIQWILASYADTDSSYDYVSGAVRKNDQNGAAVWSANNDATAWTDVSAQGASTIVAVVVDAYSSSYYGSLSVSRALWEQSGATREASIVTRSGTVDVKHNYWGTFPKVLDVISLGSPGAANIEGFTGVAFDGTWSKGPYKGGETLSAPQSWSGDVFVTGNLTVSGTTLDLAAGTRVLFAPVDQDGNGTGDYTLTVRDTALAAAGTAVAPVTFTSAGGDIAKAFQEVKVLGSGTSTIAWAIFRNGSTGLHLETGTHGLADVVLRDNFVQGLLIKSNTTGSVTLDRVEATANARGMLWNAARNVTATALNVHHNSGDGLLASGSTTALAIHGPSRFENNGGNGLWFADSSATGIADCTFAYNGANGVYIQGTSTVPLDWCNVQYNGTGLRYEGAAQGTLSHSNVKLNKREGVLLLSSGTANPAPVINGCNFIGNAVDWAGIVVAPGPAVSTTAGNYGTFDSTPWATPAGETVLAIRVQYSDTDSSYDYVSGSVRAGSGSGPAVWSTSGDEGPLVAWVESAGATALVSQVVDAYSSSYYGSTTVSGIYYLATNTPTEVRKTQLTAMTNGGTVNCTGNYWGDFDVMPRFSLVRSDAIDFQGFVGAPIDALGPRI